MVYSIDMDFSILCSFAGKEMEISVEVSEDNETNIFKNLFKLFNSLNNFFFTVFVVN